MLKLAHLTSREYGIREGRGVGTNEEEWNHYEMRFTPSEVIDAPGYYVDHFNGKYNVDKVTVLRNLELESDPEAMPSSLKQLSVPTHILDLTNNNLTELPNLRYRTDIHTLLLSRNRINQDIDGRKLPRNIKRLVLADNGIEKLGDISGLRRAPKSLSNLILRGNKICHLEGYREYVIQLLPGLHTFDCTKISDKEREDAKQMSAKLLERINAEKKEDKKVNGKDASNRDKNIAMMDFVVSKMSEERRAELRKELASASSLDEIMRLEKLLSGGV